MSPRVRMARKRLAIARERASVAYGRWLMFGVEKSAAEDWIYAMYQGKLDALSAIERRKDKTA